MKKIKIEDIKKGIHAAFDDVAIPTTILEISPQFMPDEGNFIRLFQKKPRWQDLTMQSFNDVDVYGESILQQLPDDVFLYYLPSILMACLDDKQLIDMHTQLCRVLAPVNTQEFPIVPSEEMAQQVWRRIALLNDAQKTAVADVFDYMAFTQMDWAARQAFEGYWHQFATRQPEIWEPWIK